MTARPVRPPGWGAETLAARSVTATSSQWLGGVRHTALLQDPAAESAHRAVWPFPFTLAQMRGCCGLPRRRWVWARSLSLRASLGLLSWSQLQVPISPNVAQRTEPSYLRSRNFTPVWRIPSLQ